MELIERPNLTVVKYLNTIDFKRFRDECYDDATEKGFEKPKLKDIKAWHSILQQFCKCVLKTKGITKRIYSYSHNTPAGLGGRLFCNNSLQSIWGKYRGELMRGIATDIDMSNAHPVILLYVCKKHEIPCPHLEFFVNNRDKCYEGFPTRDLAKRMFLIATNTDKTMRGKNITKTLKDYDKEMKEIQKKLVEIPDYEFLKQTVPESKRELNYNGSFVNRILCYYENEILNHAIHVINRKGIEISVLMFDGLMVYGDFYNNPELLDDIKKYVDEQMEGLNMKWAYKQHNDEFKIPEDFDESKVQTPFEYRFVKDDNQASELIYNELKDRLFYIKKRMFLKKETNVWFEDDNYVNDYVLNYIMKSNICLANDDDKYVPYAQYISRAKNVRETLFVKIRTERNNDDLYEKFHSSTRNRIAFLDGVLDFKTKRFYNWQEIDFEYYTTVQIQRNYLQYFNEPNKKQIEDLKNKIFKPLFNDKTDTALHFLSRAITGNYQDKKFATYIGNRNCGKGVLFDCLKSSFEKYVSSFQLGNILHTRKMDTSETSRKLYWLIDYEFVRFAVSQETPPHTSGLKVDCELLKKMQSGGDEQTARRNFDRTDTKFTIDTTFMFMGNNELLYDTADALEECVQFVSVNKFVSNDEKENEEQTREEELKTMLENKEITKEEYENFIEISKIFSSSLSIKDDTIKDSVKTDEWKDAVIYLLFENYRNEPVFVQRDDDNDNDVETVNGFRWNFLKQYEITRKSDDMVICDELYRNFDYDKKKIAKELEGLGIIKKKSKSRDATRDKLCFIGLKDKFKGQPDDALTERVY